MMKFEKSNVGMWFLPQSPNEKLSGTLEISENGRCSLNISHDFGNIDKIGTIHGFMANGKKVTLLNCIRTNQQWGFPGFPVTVYTSSIAIIGEWYRNEEDVIISEITASYNYLNYWINNRPFTILGNDEKKEIYMTYSMPNIIKCDTGKEEIEFTYKVNTKGDLYSNFEVHQSEYVRFIYPENIQYQRALESVYNFSNFLTLCIGKRILPVTVTSKNRDGEVIEIIYSKDQIDDQKVREHELYIKFNYIKDSFENCMISWESKREMLEPIIGYFVETHEKGFRIPMSFLKIVQAIEAYSRRMRKNEVLPPEEFDKKVQSILDKLENSEDQSLIRSILSNEPRLRQRLTELFNETNYIINISSKKRKSLINKIVDTRNYYTHFDQSLVEKILEPKEMYYVSRLMKVILRVLLLQELNLSRELIISRMLNDQELINVKEGLELIPRTKLFDIKIKPVENEKSNPSSDNNGCK